MRTHRRDYELWRILVMSHYWTSPSYEATRIFESILYSKESDLETYSSPQTSNALSMTWTEKKP